MSYTGHCNCEAIRITLAEKPANTTICQCSNCRRSGGGVCSINYLVNEDEIKLEDPSAGLKIYNDPRSLSGNVIRRHFCSNCGSPIMTKTPKLPGKVFLKAALFDEVPPPVRMVFNEEQPEWLKFLDQSGKPF